MSWEDMSNRWVYLGCICSILWTAWLTFSLISQSSSFMLDQHIPQLWFEWTSFKIVDEMSQTMMMGVQLLPHTTKIGFESLPE